MGSILTSTFNTRFISRNRNSSLIIRSDKIDNCSDLEIKELKKHGICTVIDFRNLENKKTNPFLESNGITLINCPMSIKKDKDELLKQYGPTGHCFEYYQFLIMQYPRIKEVFQQIIRCNEGFLINCSAGRDRTGVISFLIEIIAGFGADKIAEDMAVSDNNLQLRNASSNLLLQSNLNYSKAKERGYKLYKWFFSTYGNTENYFKVVFENENDLNNLRQKIERCLNN